MSNRSHILVVTHSHSELHRQLHGDRKDERSINWNGLSALSHLAAKLHLLVAS